MTAGKKNQDEQDRLKQLAAFGPVFSDLGFCFEESQPVTGKGTMSEPLTFPWFDFTRRRVVRALRCWSRNADYIATLGIIKTVACSRACPPDPVNDVAVEPCLIKHGAGPQRTRHILNDLRKDFLPTDPSCFMTGNRVREPARIEV